MRRVLVDLARARQSSKRGGGVVHVTFDEALIDGDRRDGDVLRLNEALDALAELDERKGRVVELRFFGGLSAEETAAVLNVSAKTVTRDWDFSRAWLKRALTHVR